MLLLFAMDALCHDVARRIVDMAVASQDMFLVVYRSDGQVVCTFHRNMGAPKWHVTVEVWNLRWSWTKVLLRSENSIRRFMCESVTWAEFRAAVDEDDDEDVDVEDHHHMIDILFAYAHGVTDLPHSRWYEFARPWADGFQTYIEQVKTEIGRSVSGVPMDIVMGYVRDLVAEA